MKKIDRHAIFAVGLVVGIAVALLFFIWAFPWFSDPPQGAGYNNSGDGQGTYQCCNRNDPQFGVQPFLRWLYVDDSLAQWTMAVFSVVATLVSTLAVILVKDTLLETRRIGEAQTRAYLGIESMMLSRPREKKDRTQEFLSS